MDGNHFFYVYEHWRPDKGTCFYVGKGKNKRAWDMKNMRNRHHMAVVSKLVSMGFCVDVRIVQKHLDEDAAFKAEIALIEHYGIENLTNMTSGGEGLRSPSAETRAKISASQKKRFRDNPHEIARMSEQRRGRKVSKETRKKLSQAGMGRTHTEEARKRISLARKAAGIPNHVRDAQRKAVTGKKRRPFSEETIAKMRIAARKREEAKRASRESA